MANVGAGKEDTNQLFKVPFVSEEYFYEYLLFDDEKDPYQMNNLPLEENKEIVAELCREMGKELKAIDDPWYKERILSDMIPY